MVKVKVTPNDVVDAAVEYCENELSKAADEAQGRVKNGIDGKIADFNAKVDATIDGAVEGTKERVKAWASKTLNKVSGGKMWGSPSCWMHLMFVEFRWMILVYYTCYTLVISTVYAIDLHAHSGDTGSDDSLFVPLIACMGGAQFEAQLSLGVKDRVWGGSEYTASTSKCQVSGPCKAHTFDSAKGPMAPTCTNDMVGDFEGCTNATVGHVQGCMLSGKLEFSSNAPANLYYIIFITIMPMYALLVLYNLFFKHGAFKGGIANKEYIQALQTIQTARWYRTYTSIVLVISLGLIIYGAMQAFDASQNAFLNHIAGSIALIVLIPSPRRIAAKVDKIEYDGEAVKENRKSAWLAITTMFNWDTSKYYEEAGRIEKLGDGALHEIKNYIEIPFLCGD